MSTVDDMAAALARLFPGEPTIGHGTIERMMASADAAPPMTDRQRRRIARALFGEGGAR